MQFIQLILNSDVNVSRDESVTIRRVAFVVSCVTQLDALDNNLRCTQLAACVAVLDFLSVEMPGHFGLGNSINQAVDFKLRWPCYVLRIRRFDEAWRWLNCQAEFRFPVVSDFAWRNTRVIRLILPVSVLDFKNFSIVRRHDALIVYDLFAILAPGDCWRWAALINTQQLHRFPP